MGIVLCVYAAFIPVMHELLRFNNWMHHMSLSSLLTPEVVLRDYFHAKDENRPYLLERVFTSDASLHINNSCSNITFPAVTQGRGSIADTLVTQFNKTYENI